MAMIRIIQTCTDGCGRTRIFKCPEGFSPIPTYSHLADEAAMAQATIDNVARAATSFDASVVAAMQRVKATDPEVSILVDDDLNPVTPPILKRIWNFIFK